MTKINLKKSCFTTNYGELSEPALGSTVECFGMYLDFIYYKIKDKMNTCEKDITLNLKRRNVSSKKVGNNESRGTAIPMTVQTNK